jgi:hypothetical protein
MGKWDKFNKTVNMDELEKQKEEVLNGAGSGNYPEVKAGSYRVKCEKLEMSETGPNSKNPGAPMLKAMFRILEGEHKKQCIFMNRVLYAANPTDNWNTERAIAVALGWLETLGVSEDIDLVFTGYDDFEDLVMDIAEDISELEYLIDYDPDDFSPISVIDVMD